MVRNINIRFEKVSIKLFFTEFQIISKFRLILNPSEKVESHSLIGKVKLYRVVNVKLNTKRENGR